MSCPVVTLSNLRDNRSPKERIVWRAETDLSSEATGRKRGDLTVGESIGLEVKRLRFRS